MAYLYHRDQAGAPAYPTANALTSTQQFAYLKDILKCLVSGFASNPGAGWSLIYETATELVLRNGSESGYFCITNAGTSYLLSISYTFEGVSGGFIVGEGAKSGVATGNSVPQRLNAFGLSHPLSTSWALVADEKSFVLSLSNNGNSSSALSLNAEGSTYSLLLVAGEDSAGNFISCGGLNTTSATGTAAQGTFSEVGFTALRFPATGFLVGSSAVAVSALYPTTSTASYLSASNVSPVESFDAVRGHWAGAGVPAGYFRGVALLCGLYRLHLGAVAKALGVTDALNTRNYTQHLYSDDDGVWVFCPKRAESSPPALITTAAEFWL